MIEITNRKTSPIQLIIRSRTKTRAFTCLNVPGKGKNKNVYYLEDERITDYVKRAEEKGLISTKYISNNTVKEGD